MGQLLTSGVNTLRVLQNILKQLVSSHKTFQRIPRRPDTRLFEVREAFKRTLLPGFRASVRGLSLFSGGPAGELCAPAALRVLRAGPVVNPLLGSPMKLLLVVSLVVGVATTWWSCILYFSRIIRISTDAGCADRRRVFMYADICISTATDDTFTEFHSGQILSPSIGTI